MGTLISAALLAADHLAGAHANAASGPTLRPWNALAAPNLMHAGARKLLQAPMTAPCVEELCPLTGDILQHHMDLNNTGVNYAAAGLGAASGQNFGLVSRRTIDGSQIYAQPLHLESIPLADGSLGAVDLLATMNNTVAMWPSDPTATQPVWSTNLGNAVDADAIMAHDITGRIGILSTPVVDRCTNTLFAVSFQIPAGGTQPNYYLFALDLLTGQSKTAEPALLQGSYPGTGQSSVDGLLTFNATQHLQRPALKIHDDILAIGFGSHGDEEPYKGWSFYVNTTTLAIQAVHALCPDSDGCALWQSGEGPGNYQGDWIWVAGNGFNSDPTQPAERTESIIRMTVQDSSVIIKDYYTPSNFQVLDDLDQDVGSNGPLITGHRVLTGGKAGILYNVNLDNMGHIAANNTAGTQQLQLSSKQIYGLPVAWGDLRFAWASQSSLQCYQDLGDAGLAQVWSGSVEASPTAFPGGGYLAVAAGDPDAAVLVALVPGGTGENATAYLFDAKSGNYIWSTLENPDRDYPGLPVKFVPPITGDKRFLTVNQAGELLTYGFNPA